MPRPEETASQLLREHHIVNPPVPVHRLARKLGARLSFEPFEDDDVSGLLFRDGTRTIIGVNAKQAGTRRRFTIAHEIGHLLLHPGQPMILDKLVQVNRRDSISSLATDRQEIEANRFAAAVLMPRDMVLTEVDRVLSRRSRASAEALVGTLAGIFKVSKQAMGYRLTNMGVLPPT